MGIPFWAGQRGSGWGFPVITDVEKQAWMGQGTNGAFSWPGAFGTWWRARSRRGHDHDSTGPELDGARPEAASQARHGQRMAAQAALPAFQNATYAALGR